MPVKPTSRHLQTSGLETNSNPEPETHPTPQTASQTLLALDLAMAHSARTAAARACTARAFCAAEAPRTRWANSTSLAVRSASTASGLSVTSEGRGARGLACFWIIKCLLLRNVFYKSLSALFAIFPK